MLTLPTFSPPGDLVHTGVNHPLFGRMRLARGVSLLKTGDIYTQYRIPSDEDLAAADVVYLGGYTYDIDSTEADDLAAAGYGEWVTP